MAELAAMRATAKESDVSHGKPTIRRRCGVAHVESAAHVPFSRLRNTTISTGMIRGNSQASIDCRRDVDLPSLSRHDDAWT